MRCLLILACLALTGCGDSAKSVFAPNTATADELAKQTVVMKRIAVALERLIEQQEGGAK
jgi:hypothetical protein